MAKSGSAKGAFKAGPDEGRACLEVEGFFQTQEKNGVFGIGTALPVGFCVAVARDKAQTLAKFIAVAEVDPG